MAEELDGVNPEEVETPTEVENEVENKEIPITVVESVNYDSFKAVLTKHADDLSRLIRLYKAKDETISKLSEEVTKYRGGFALQLVKPVCVSLISYREDCKKTLVNLAQFAKGAENVKTYCDYLLSDLEEIMITYGLEVSGEVFTLNGVKLTEIVPRKAKKIENEGEPESAESEQTDAENGVDGFGKMSYSFDSLIDVVDESYARVENLLKDCVSADVNLKNYVALAASIEENYSDSILLPLYKQIASLHNKLKTKVEEVKEKIDDSNVAKLYAEPLKLIVDEAEEILTCAGVTVESDITNVYDMKTCKIVKVVNTEDAELDKTVAKRHTDCYLFDGKILYPSKVEVYKYVPKKD